MRYKMLVAAMAVVAIIGALGALGFHYITAVARSVSITTERTSPLLARALTASEATRRLVDLGRDTERVCAIETRSAEGNTSPLWRAEFDAIDQLRKVAREAGLETHAERLGDASRALFETLSSISSLCRESRQATTGQKAKEEETLQGLNSLSAAISGLALTLDGDMTVNEEHAKVALQVQETDQADIQNLLSRTLLDTWPMLRSLYKLREYIVRLKDSVSTHAGVEQFADLDNEAKHRTEILSAIRALIQRISPRLRASGRSAQAAELNTFLTSLNSNIKGTAGVEGMRRLLLDLHGRAEESEEGLMRVEERLSTEMRRLEQEARALDAGAQSRMHETIREAMLVIGIVAGLAALGTFFGAVRLAYRLTGPIEALTQYTRALRKSTNTDQPVSRELVARHDEIGRLAFSFNDLLAALSEARRRLLEESRAEIKVQFERLKAAIEGMPQGVYLLGPDRRLLLSNAHFAELYNLERGQVEVGLHSDDIAEACRNGTGIRTEVVEPLPGRNGETGMSQSIRTLQDGRIIAVTTAPTSEGGEVVVHEDISERRRAEARIAHMAHHDALTGLANRVLFREQTNASLRNLRKGETMAVLYMDLDHFKSVNDTLGHPVGDRLLVMAAKRLCTVLREGDHVARLSGDEFALVLNENPALAEVGKLADRIIESVSQLYDIDGQQVVIGASIGIAMAVGGDDADADRLMKNADMALYRAKKDGRNTFCFFETEMDARMQERRTLELALRKAIAAEGLQVHYQPVINLSTNQVEEFEALLRWPDSMRGLISPEVFIPLAEETGLINEISSWVLKQACRDAATWPSHIRVAVNISPLQFRTRTLVLNVISALEASGLSPDRLELEITEGVLLHDTQSTLQILKQLQGLGVHIAMDDFGTGYSSLSYLRKFNFNKVKIDRSFVKSLDSSKDSRAIIRAVSGLCSTLGIDVTAEGVETESQLHTLREEGCTQVQGYLLGRPGPVSTVAHYFGRDDTEVGKRKA